MTADEIRQVFCVDRPGGSRDSELQHLIHVFEGYTSGGRPNPYSAGSARANSFAAGWLVRDADEDAKDAATEKRHALTDYFAREEEQDDEDEGDGSAGPAYLDDADGPAPESD